MNWDWTAGMDSSGSVRAAWGRRSLDPLRGGFGCRRIAGEGRPLHIIIIIPLIVPNQIEDYVFAYAADG